MGQIVVRELDDGVVAALERKARAHGHSLEAEVRELLTSAAHRDREAFRQLSAGLRARFGPFDGPDSVEMIREDRER